MVMGLELLGIRKEQPQACIRMYYQLGTIVTCGHLLRIFEPIYFLPMFVLLLGQQ